MEPKWVLNKIKYQRAKNAARNPADEKEIQALYVSYGGLLGDIVVENETIAEIATTEPEVEEVVLPVKKGRKKKMEPEEVKEVVEETVEESTDDQA